MPRGVWNTTCKLPGRRQRLTEFGRPAGCVGGLIRTPSRSAQVASFRPRSSTGEDSLHSGSNGLHRGIDVTSSDDLCHESRINCSQSGIDSTRYPMNCTPSRIHWTPSGIHSTLSGIDSSQTLSLSTPSEIHSTWTGTHSTRSAIHCIPSAINSLRREMRCPAGRSAGRPRGSPAVAALGCVRVGIRS